MFHLPEHMQAAFTDMDAKSQDLRPNSVHPPACRGSGEHAALQGAFCKLCECWVPGKQHGRVWQQHVHSPRHKRAVTTSNYRSEASTARQTVMCNQQC